MGHRAGQQFGVQLELSIRFEILSGAFSYEALLEPAHARVVELVGPSHIEPVIFLGKWKTTMI